MIYQQIQKDWVCTHLWFLERSTTSNVQKSKYSLECCWRLLLRQASASWMQRDLQCLICGHDSDFLGFFILCFAQNIPYSCFFCVRPFLNSLGVARGKLHQSLQIGWLRMGGKKGFNNYGKGYGKWGPAKLENFGLKYTTGSRPETGQLCILTLGGSKKMRLDPLPFFCGGFQGFPLVATVKSTRFCWVWGVHLVCTALQRCLGLVMFDPAAQARSSQISEYESEKCDFRRIGSVGSVTLECKP